MREKLKILAGKRITVHATVQRFGTKKAYKGPPLQTVCLVELRDSLGNFLCDHLWLVVRKQMGQLHLAVGDRITFTARSTPYIKGYRGRRVSEFEMDEDDYKPVKQDYKLANPTKFEVTRRAQTSMKDELRAPDLFYNPLPTDNE